MCPPSCAIWRMKVNLDSKSQEIAQMKVKTNLFSNEIKTIKTQRNIRSIWLVRTYSGRLQVRYGRLKLFHTHAHRVKHLSTFCLKSRKCCRRFASGLSGNSTTRRIVSKLKPLCVDPTGKIIFLSIFLQLYWVFLHTVFLCDKSSWLVRP